MARTVGLLGLARMERNCILSVRKLCRNEIALKARLHNAVENQLHPKNIAVLTARADSNVSLAARSAFALAKEQQDLSFHHVVSATAQAATHS